MSTPRGGTHAGDQAHATCCEDTRNWNKTRGDKHAETYTHHEAPLSVIGPGRDVNTLLYNVPMFG